MKRLLALGLVSAVAVTIACEEAATGGKPPIVATGALAAASKPAVAIQYSFGDKVTVHLVKILDGALVASFGVPLPPDVKLNDVSSIRVVSHTSGAPIAASVRETLATHDASGARTGVRSVAIQLPASVVGDSTDIDVVWHGGAGHALGSNSVAFMTEGVSGTSESAVTTAVRTIASRGGVNSLVETQKKRRVLFTGREPKILATFPEGYLAKSGILGQQVTAAEAAQPARAGLSFLSNAIANYSLSSMYAEAYAINPESVIDPVQEYEGWLYDRCATYLTAYFHTNDVRSLREANRSCSYYASKIALSGEDRGTFSGKSPADTKYSHLRGLYAYYALTGDEVALNAGKAIADLWLHDKQFVAPYASGHLRGPDKLWTERLLGTSLEGLYYGSRLTGDPVYLALFKKLFDTAYRHITGDAATLAKINPGARSFPPQNCLIHSAEQQSEGNADEPWCSTWMSELMIDPLLRYQEQTGDDRVDEMFIRLTRFLRDVGAVYMTGNPLKDSFLEPSVCDKPSDDDSRRMLIPLYGSGIDANGKRRISSEDGDDQHCSDATALTAAALRALMRQGKFNANPVGPFKSEGASFLQLHHELAFCAKRVFADQSRPRRDPSAWNSNDLAQGLSNPTEFIKHHKIGYPRNSIGPQRKFSWWFNMAMLQYGLLAEAGIEIPSLNPGAIQPKGMNCN